MRATLGITAALGLLAALGEPASAQDDGDIAAWSAMMLTPYGALPPLVTPLMFATVDGDDQGGGFEARYGRWSFDEGEDEAWNIFGAGGRAGPFGFGFGYGKCGDCTDGVFMANVEFESDLVRSAIGASEAASTLVIGLRPSLGFAKPGGDSRGNAFTAAVDVPFTYNAPAGGGSRLALFIAPGYGFGRISEQGESDSGTRASLAAGVGLRTSRGPALHVAWRRILIDEGPSLFGVGVSFGS